MTVLEFERRRRRWNQTALAFLAGGLTQGEISRYERGRALPSPAAAERLGQALGVPPEALLDDAGKEPTR